MHEIVAFLKDAVDRGPSAGLGSCYIVRDGHMYARNFAIQAGIPWPAGVSFTVSAVALDAALARMVEVKKLTVEADSVIVSSGRLRSTIRRVHQEPPPVPPFPEEWEPSPPGLARALRMAVPFLGERTWQLGVRLMAGRVTAFSPRAGIDVELPLTLERPFLLIGSIAKYIADQGDPDELAAEPNAASFRYEDGRWMRAQFINDEMPEGVIRNIFDRAGAEAPVLLDGDWREALADAAALADGKVKLTARGFAGIKENMTTEVELATGLTEGHESYWDAKVLAEVFAVAAAWNPAAWPDPSLFIGPGLRGVVAGLQR